MTVYKRRGENRSYILTASRYAELQQAAKIYRVYIQGDHRAPYVRVSDFAIKKKNALETPTMMAGIETGGNRITSAVASAGDKNASAGDKNIERDNSSSRMSVGLVTIFRKKVI